MRGFSSTYQISKILLLILCCSLCEFFQCAKTIKITMDEKYGQMGAWQVLSSKKRIEDDEKFQVVVGESFGVDMTYDIDSLFFFYFLGTVGCLVWRCSPS